MKIKPAFQHLVVHEHALQFTLKAHGGKATFSWQEASDRSQNRSREENSFPKSAVKPGRTEETLTSSFQSSSRVSLQRQLPGLLISNNTYRAGDFMSPTPTDPRNHLGLKLMLGLGYILCL